MDISHSEMTPRLLDALYIEAMVLADEARSYFDRGAQNNCLSSEISVAFSCESLKVTTRLMHSIAWLLNQKALRAGEISAAEAGSDSRDLGYAPASDDFQISSFPEEAQSLIWASEDLYFRLSRICNALRYSHIPAPVPHAMVDRIQQSF